jgi:diaminopimelate epimerase
MTLKKISFTKMTGAGNDFIIVESPITGNIKILAQKVCERTTGIGADGLLVIDKSKKADFQMRIFNADGSQAEMCGNGARCMAAYIARNKKTRKKLFSLETMAGIILAEANGQIACVRLSSPKNLSLNIPLNLSDRILKVHYLDTGVPHTIVYVDNLANIDVNRIGRQVRCHKQFAPRGTNVNFVEQLNQNLIAVRTYERGVEAETRACGTGSVASALISFILSNPTTMTGKGKKMNVRTVSGEILCITFDLAGCGDISNVWLKGSAKVIAEGVYFL